MDPRDPGSPESLLGEARWWHDNDPDPANRLEAAEIIGRGDARELAQRFGQRLRFGTAGLRAVLGAGPMRLNRLVARQTAAGIAAGGPTTADRLGSTDP